jgi:actin-related protein
LVFVSPGAAVEDWDMMEAVLDYSVSERLKMQSNSAQRDISLAGHPFLLCDHLNSSKADRERWCQLLFEKYQVAGVFVSKAGVLALYANARTTGMAIDMGANSTTITPVQDGFPLMMGMRIYWPCDRKPHGTR